MKVNADAEAFAGRLIALLEKNGRKRRGSGAYLAKKYKVSIVVANAWLNGEYKPGIPIAEKIAEDHGSTLDELYFNRKPGSRPRRAAWPFDFDKSRYDALTPGQKIKAQAALYGTIVDMEDERESATAEKSTARPT